MVDLSFEKLLNGDKNLQFEPNVGRGSKGNIDKTACFYHVITKSFNGGNIYNWETANYRHTLLSQQCEKRGIKIIFSLTMPNHTHDVFLTPSWDDLVDVLRTVNSKVTQHLRLSDPKKFKKGVRIIRKYPAFCTSQGHCAAVLSGKIYIRQSKLHEKRDQERSGCMFLDARIRLFRGWI